MIQKWGEKGVQETWIHKGTFHWTILWKGGGYSSTIHSMPGQVTTVKDNTDFNISIFVV